MTTAGAATPAAIKVRAAALSLLTASRTT